MSLYTPRKRHSSINVIPLIDVMTVLIIFLLITTRFDEADSLAITPPAAESAGKTGDDDAAPTVLAVNKEGAFFIDGKPVERDALSAALKTIAASSPGATVLVVADEAAATGETVYALDRVKVAGLAPRLVARGAP